MDQLHKAFHYSTDTLRIFFRWVLISLGTLSVAAANELTTAPSGYRLEFSTGIAEGTDLLAGAEGVYYKFTGAPTPSDSPSTQPKTATTQGSTLSLNDGNTELYFQRINPRIETRVQLERGFAISPATEVTPSLFLSKSSVRYAFERGIGLLVDPARLDYKTLQFGVGLALTQTIDLPIVDWLSISPFGKFYYSHNQTKLHSSLIDVTSSTRDTQFGFGITAQLKPLRSLPLAFEAGVERDSESNVYLRASIGFTQRF